jgi:hypothetical protein
MTKRKQERIDRCKNDESVNAPPYDRYPADALEHPLLSQEELLAVIATIRKERFRLMSSWMHLRDDFEKDQEETPLLQQLAINTYLLVRDETEDLLSEKEWDKVFAFSEDLCLLLEDFRSQEAEIFFPRLSPGKIEVERVRFDTFYQCRHAMQQLVKADMEMTYPYNHLCRSFPLNSVCQVRIGGKFHVLAIEHLIHDPFDDHIIREGWRPTGLSERGRLRLEGWGHGHVLAGEHRPDKERVKRVEQALAVIEELQKSRPKTFQPGPAPDAPATK